MLTENFPLKLETLKLEKDGVDGKLAGLLKASKNLDNLIESQRSDKIHDGLGYSDVPPPPAQLYLSLKKDLSWTGLLECNDDTVTDYSRPSPTVEKKGRKRELLDLRIKLMRFLHPDLLLTDHTDLQLDQ
nr:hypothetical protein [Tanacetum cinerariifolium]